MSAANPHDPLAANDGFDNDGANGVACDRRRSHREPIVAIGHLLSTVRDARASQRPVPVLVTDISLHGCDFRCEVNPEAGTFFRLELAVGPLSLTTRLRVIRTRARFDGTFEVGAEFI